MDSPRFVLHACVGAGGFGEVYRATERTEGGITREVAVKVLHDAMDAESDAVKRLRDEGRMLGMLAHPAVLGVHELATVDGRLALVTEYVAGSDLAELFSREPGIPPRVAMLVTQVVAEALDVAWCTPNPTTGRPLHLVHRDVKPENIRISVNGQVKLLDFGVARTTEMHRLAKTAAGQVVLTPGYGAPETLTFGVVGPAVDVFALGAVLFAMITGEAFYADLELGHQVKLAGDSVEYAAHLDSRLQLVEHEGTRELLRRMLAFAHELRPTMEEVAVECDQLARGLEGPSLLQWTRTADYPEPLFVEGRLVGMEVLHDGTVRPASEVAPDEEPAAPPVADAAAETWFEKTEGPSASDGEVPERSEPFVRPPPTPLVSIASTQEVDSAPADLHHGGARTAVPVEPEAPEPVAPETPDPVTPAPAPAEDPAVVTHPTPPPPKAPPGPLQHDQWRFLGVLLVGVGAVLLVLGAIALGLAFMVL